ncbi:MAG: Grx4 family monothiol glutaredoxin [Kofleriaceae bacterium]
MPLSPEQRQKPDTLVQSDPVVLFMKGTRSLLQCGFSAAVVGILDSLVPKYATVNILADAEIRGGMKEYSDWPTFPQLYIKGEFVGGADIVRQMHDSGELAGLLGSLAAPPAPPTVTITRAPRPGAGRRPRGRSPGDVIHLTIPGLRGSTSSISARARPATSPSPPARQPRGPARSRSAARAQGVVIDFVEGPSGGGFKIDNPNRPAVVRQVGPKELKALLDSGAVKELFDVRTPAERATAKLAGARH